MLQFSLSVQQWLKQRKVKAEFSFWSWSFHLCADARCFLFFCPLIDAVVGFFFVLAFWKHGFLAICHLMPLGWWFSPALVSVRIEVMGLFCEKNLLGDEVPVKVIGCVEPVGQAGWPSQLFFVARLHIWTSPSKGRGKGALLPPRPCTPTPTSRPRL